jgi:4-carboxymuconolactone decarboxylase
MKPIYFGFLLSALFFVRVQAQEVSIFPKGELSAADNHTGNVWLYELNKPDSIFNISIAEAAFARGAKLDWHIHPAGQILLITNGTGYYQEKGRPVQTVHKGDVIKCMQGVVHWHGAAPNSNFAYIAVTPAQKGKTLWLQRVAETEYNDIKPPASDSAKEKQEIINLSAQKWLWMAEKNTDSLNMLFDENSVFVHMGGSWGKEPELNVIKSGGIHYKKADIHSVSVQVIGNTAMLLNNITLLAVVGGNEVTNPFIVTEVYIKEKGKWMLGSLSFTKQLTPADTKH